MGTQKSCTCEVCKEMCSRPCWGTPKEFHRIIAAGFGDRLMLDMFDITIKDDIYLLTPARQGGERSTIHIEYFKRHGTKCTFQDKNGLCLLHDLGLKPKEGRVTWCQDKKHISRYTFAKLWRTEKAQRLVNRWLQHYCNDKAFTEYYLSASEYIPT